MRRMERSGEQVHTQSNDMSVQEHDVEYSPNPHSADRDGLIISSNNNSHNNGDAQMTDTGKADKQGERQIVQAYLCGIHCTL